MTRPRLVDHGHPDRPLAVEEALDPGYHSLISKAISNGISEEEAALAIESLAQAHLETIATNRATEAEIAAARREAGLPAIADDGPRRRGEWMVAVGTLIWCALFFSTAYLAFWALMPSMR